MSLKYPPMAIVSIFHRLSGLVLFLLTPALLYFFHLSIQSPDSFAHWQNVFATCYFTRAILWVFSVALLYHIMAGIRHISMDLGVGESLRAGRVSANIVLFLTIIATLFLGIWLW